MEAVVAMTICSVLVCIRTLKRRSFYRMQVPFISLSVWASDICCSAFVAAFTCIVIVQPISKSEWKKLYVYITLRSIHFLPVKSNGAVFFLCIRCNVLVAPSSVSLTPRLRSSHCSAVFKQGTLGQGDRRIFTGTPGGHFLIFTPINRIRPH